MWEPIATVPRTGEVVLVYAPTEHSSILAARWFAWADGSREYLTPDGAGDGELDATHWMPMPSDPVDSLTPP